MGARIFQPSIAFNGTISGTSPVSTLVMQPSSHSNFTWQLDATSGLTATIKVMGSVDGVTFFDTGAFFPDLSGSAATLGANLSERGHQYTKLIITPSAGSANVVVKFSAKEG